MVFLAKLGELTLKGGNLKFFEKRLTDNLRSLLEGVEAQIYLRSGRMYVYGPEKSGDAIRTALRHLIGITGWAQATVCEKDPEKIKAAVEAIAEKAKAEGAKSFKIDARRADKAFPMNSYQIAQFVSNDIFENGVLAVDLHNPDIKISVEIREKAFIYGSGEKGHRGLPVGTGGKGLLLLSGGIDSPVAGYRMLRRGMTVDCIYFHAYPYTSDEALQKVEDLAAIVARYGIFLRLNVIPFTDFQMRIKEKSPESYSTLLLRMGMVKVANLVASHIGAKCLITGESLGQVASQTVENMTCTESMAELPMLRPLVGMDKEEIIYEAKKIGTYETSILPYEDCCVLFSPEHPVLRADVAEAQEIFRNLDGEDLIAEAFKNREVKHFTAKNALQNLI